MNTKRKNEVIKEASKVMINRVNLELEIVYSSAYHEGRHDYRDKVKDFLIINPEMKVILEELKEDPCKECSNYKSTLKMGCLECNNCLLKQNQLTAIDILKHFK